jgi:hypothetical protein
MKTREQAQKSGDVLVPATATPGEDVNTGIIVRSALGMVVVLLLVSAFLVVYMRMLAGREIRHDPSLPSLAQHDPGRPPEGVRLQEQPFTDVEALRRREHAQLEQYGWVDQKAGIVHIPILTAMQLLVHRGLPTRAPDAALTAATAAPTPSPRPRPAATRAKPRPAPRRSPAEAIAPNGQPHAIENPALEGTP